MWRFQITLRRRVPENTASGKASGHLPENFRNHAFCDIYWNTSGKLPDSFRKASGTMRFT